MSMTAIPELFLYWLKRNTEHYRYNTPEARELEKRIVKADLESDDGLRELEQCYQEFVRLLEKNPLNGTDENGKSAAILAEDFKYLFYPNNEKIYIPIQIFIESGGISTQEKADALYEKMLESVVGWEEDAAKKKKAVREVFVQKSSQVVEQYGKLLNKPVHSVGFWIKEILMFLLVALCGAQIAGSIFEGTAAAMDHMEWAGFFLGCIIVVVFLIKAMQWMVREKKRRELIRDWRECATSNESQQERPMNGFRNADHLKVILEQQIRDGNRCVGAKSIDQNEDKAVFSKKVRYDRFFEKGSLKSCCGIRPIHLIVMTLTFICLLLTGASGIFAEWKDPIEKFKRTVHAELEARGQMVSWIRKKDLSRMSDLQDGLNLKMQTANPGVHLFADSSGEFELREYASQGENLYCLGWEEDNEQEIWYWVRDYYTEDEKEGYVCADDVKIVDGLEMWPDYMTVKDAEAHVKNVSLNNLRDGKLLTSVSLEKEDVIELDYSYKCRFRYMYLINGNMSAADSFEEDGMVKKLRIVFDGTTEYIVWLEQKKEAFGYLVRLPDVVASKIQLFVEETYGNTAKAALTELKLCGMRIE